MRRHLTRALLALAGVVSLHGIFSHKLLSQHIWEPEGLTRFLLFAVAYAAASAWIVWRAPRRFPACIGAGALLYAGMAAGPVAPLALLCLLAACWWLGSLWLDPEPALAILLGLALWMAAVMASASLPVHYRSLYWACALAAGAAAWRRTGFKLPPIDCKLPRSQVAPLAVLLFPLCCYWLLALKPEVSSDGLAMHVVIPARMAAAHAWPFDVREFTWAVMPMGGDWAWSIAWQLGGEACARLLNVTLAAMAAFILHAWLRVRMGAWPAALLVAALLATPLTAHVSGSLFVENVAAALLLGALMMFRRARRHPEGRWFVAACFLCGAAAATKFGALAFALPMLALAAIRTAPRRLAAGLAASVAVGSIPYLNAFWRTGNPLFPFFNATFQSPLYPLENFRDLRFETPLSWTSFYDLTFHSSRFLEGQDGSAGFLFFLLLPAALLNWKRRDSTTATMALAAGLAGSVLILAGQSNLRYLYPAFPLLAAAIGASLAAERAARWGMALALILHLALLPAAGWYHKDFTPILAFRPANVDAYLARSAPERRLVDWLNANAPDAHVAWLEGSAIGDFRGRAFTNSWHSDRFIRRLRAAGSAEDLLAIAREFRLQYFILPSPESPRPLSHVYTREFCDTHTRIVARFSDMELRRFGPSQAASQPPQAFAGPGQYDEITPFTRFTGAWTRDLQFKSAYRQTLVYTNDARAAARIHFHGNGIRLFYTAASNRCAARVLLDGEEVPGFDQHARDTRWQSESPVFRAAAPGRHVLTLQLPASRNAGCYLDLDGFTVE